MTMDPVHREVLDVNHTHLVHALHGADILARLRTDDVINKYDYDQLRRTEAQGPKAFNRLLLLTLRRRGGSDAYASLHRALRENGQDDLCDVLLDCELALRDGLASDRLQTELAAYVWQQEMNGRLSPTTSLIITKPTSPAFRPPSTLTPTPRDSHGRRDADSARDKKSPSPALSSKQKEEQEKERRLQQLQEEVAEMRSTHTKMESELRQQIQQLEKDRDKLAAKKGGGCVLM